MKRREFFKQASVATIGAAAAGTLAAPAIAQDTITWRMVTTWPKNFPGLGVGAQKLADRITKASGGRLTVQVFAAGEMVPGLQALDAVIDGSAEMSHGAAYYWQNKSQGLSFFTGVPFGMTNRELGAWVRYLGPGAVGQDLRPVRRAGVPLGRYRHPGGRLVQERADGRGRYPGPAVPYARPRRAGVGQARRFGDQSRGGEIFAALQSGTLDAAEFVGPYNDLALGFYQVAKNYYFPSFVERALPPKWWSTRPSSRRCGRPPGDRAHCRTGFL